ncbi:MAG: hypothetical protein H7Z73_03440 [Candidatus Saccharibacteria bacterium]|nr:hypothetical protein [Moraxellaceae bacterium]
MKKLLIIKIAFVLLFLGLYLFFWRGFSEPFSLSKPSELKPNCYIYQSDSDIKAIAELGIMQNLGDINALEDQKRLVINNHSTSNEYYFSGRPSGILRYMTYYLLGIKHANVAIVTLTRDRVDHCLYITEALYQKD